MQKVREAARDSSGHMTSSSNEEHWAQTVSSVTIQKPYYRPNELLNSVHLHVCVNVNVSR